MGHFLASESFENQPMEFGIQGKISHKKQECLVMKIHLYAILGWEVRIIAEN